MSSKAVHPFPPVVPPQGFTTVHFGSLYRALDTIDGDHIGFVKRLQLGSVLVVTTKPLHETFLTFLEDEGIAVHYLLSDIQYYSNDNLDRVVQFGASSIGMSEDWMKRALELLFSLSRHPVLIIGSAASCVDVAIISCLRRIQHWGLVSVLANFRQLTGRKIYDLEQFIEFFNASVVRIPHHRIPAYLEMFLATEFPPEIMDDHLNIKAAGKKDKDSKKSKSKSQSDGGSEEISHILHFDDWNTQQQNCISSLSQFDPSISLVTDDVTDD